MKIKVAVCVGRGSVHPLLGASVWTSSWERQGFKLDFAICGWHRRIKETWQSQHPERAVWYVWRGDHKRLDGGTVRP